VNNSKSYNQILFITTLSVYLGLVLVGASPQVLAQAALTQEQYFEQLEKTNTLEMNKQIDDKNLFVPTIHHLVTELNKLSNRGEFDWNHDYRFKIEGLTFCKSDNSVAYLGSSIDLGEEVGNLLDKFSVKLGRELSKRQTKLGFGDIYSHSLDFGLSTAKNQFSVLVKISTKSPEETKGFHSALNAYFENFSRYTSLSAEKIIYDGTTVTSADNQVIISTRLPRGSIDSLLKQ
jgi:hypothetical protein